MNLNANQLIKELKNHANEQYAKTMQRFFKTGPGEYGENDQFIGVRNPQIRTICKLFNNLSYAELQKCISHPIHEIRFACLVILSTNAQKFQKQGLIDELNHNAKFYIKNKKYINNWDLVDISAYKVLGPVYLETSKADLLKWAHSNDLWTRRISIITTLYFIKKKHYETTLEISKILLSDKHDLIHKAVGWMLREVGKENIAIEEAFLKGHYHNMPRTMLRYAIEKFPEKKRLLYLKSKI
ncbi:MAG: DNA alkylation repair protein [Halobacteriovoraceae bacterium]|nr:DNA alkylation repair protein [Halobacteriovoraceae bacterium]